MKLILKYQIEYIKVYFIVFSQLIEILKCLILCFIFFLLGKVHKKHTLKIKFQNICCPYYIATKEN